MMVISFSWGQKHYRIPYAWRKLVAYMVIAVAFYGLHAGFRTLDLNVWLNHAVAVLLLSVYAWFIALVEREELKRLPYIGKFFRAKSTIVADA